jgi:hypothetical protein
MVGDVVNLLLRNIIALKQKQKSTVNNEGQFENKHRKD